MTTSNNNTDSYPYDEPMYPDGQTIVLEIMPYFSATPSVMGSTLIIWSIWCSRKVSLRIAYHRLMLAISLMDFLVSFSMIVLGPWVVPSEVGFTLLGRSNTFVTCDVAGFFLNLAFGTMWISAFLALYFLVTLRFGWKERTIAWVLEPIAYFTGFVYPVVSGTIGLIHNSFNPMREVPGWCWYFDYKAYCSTLDGAPECERGEDYNEKSGIGDAGIVLFLLVTIVVSMVLIVLKVRKTEKQLRQYDSGQIGRLHRTRETSWQAILYIASFFCVYFPIVMLHALGHRHGDKNPDGNAAALFPFALLTKTLTPMQGVFNAYIYLRKKFWKLTKEGECFAFMRRIPFLGSWVSEKSDFINSRSSRGSSEQTRRRRQHSPQHGSMQPTHSHQVLTRKQYSSTAVESIPNGGDLEETALPAEQNSDNETSGAPPAESERTLKDEPSDRKVADG